MSYILDALKKSDEERKRGVTPDPLTNHSVYPGHGSKKMPKSKSLLWSFVVFSALTSIGYMTYSFTTKEKAIDTSTQLAPPQILVKIPSSVKTQPSPANISDQSNTAVNSSKKKSTPIVFEPPPIIPSGQTIPTRKPSPHQNTDLSIPFYAELPKNIQLAIPKLEYAGHTYSDASSKRIIIINNIILREGDAVEEGFYLKEITWQGVVLDFHGTIYQESL